VRADLRQLEQNHVIGVFLSEEGRRVEVTIARQNVVNLKEVMGREAGLNQGILNRL
jgi:hypothetical protein